MNDSTITDFVGVDLQGLPISGADRGRGPAASAAAPPPCSGSLVSYALNGTREKQEVDQGQESDRLLLLDCSCRSWCCPKCAAGYSTRVFLKIGLHLAMFKRPRLVTITVDRKHHANGQAAFEHVEGKNGLIRRFLRLMGFKKAVKVLAFHPKNPEWPHWHILVDLADCGTWVDRVKAWRLMRDRWHVGRIDLPLKLKFKTDSPMAAARYALGYLQKQSGQLPDWVLGRKRAPRSWEAYGELRRAMRNDAKAKREALEAAKAADVASVDEAAPEAEQSPARAKRARASSTVRERLAECGKSCTVMAKQVFGNKTVWRFVGTLGQRAAWVAMMTRWGLLRTVDVRTVTRSFGADGESKRIEVYVPVDGRKSFKDEFERMRIAVMNLTGSLPANLMPQVQRVPCPGAAVDFVGDGVAPF